MRNDQKRGRSEEVVYSGGDSMIFKISWAADLSRSGTVWFRSGMVPSCHINNQKFGVFMFDKIITKKMILIGLIPSHKESPNF